tara:strand:- start:262 stop:543 length:282 start_codon:yes stop_codon:yes gene_type:complete
MDNSHSNQNKGNSEWKNRELGALWKKEGKSQKFYSGYIKINKGQDNEQEVPIVVFLNKLKSNERAPDLLVYKSEDSNKKAEVQHDDVPDTFLD